MKPCPFCAEEIQDAAIKCKHCGEFLDGRAPEQPPSNQKWYFRSSFIVLALGCAGPLALPLIWLHPDLRKLWKWLLSVAIIALSVVLLMATVKSIHVLGETYGEMLEMLNGY